MMELHALTRLLPGMDVVEITTWIERGWVRPNPSGESWVFEEIDVARVRLIRDLRQNMALTEDAVPVVLDLLDQVYALRGTLQTVLRALDGQPPDVRQTVLGALARREP